MGCLVVSGDPVELVDKSAYPVIQDVKFICWTVEGFDEKRMSDIS